MHEPATDLIDIAEQAFSEATEKHILVEDNRADIHQTFNEIIDKAIGHGEVIVTGKTVTKLIADYVWQKVNSTSGRRSQKYLRDLRSGQIPAFEIEATLDVVLTAGAERRTTLRHLQTDDVERMLAERVSNHAKSTKALTEFEEIAAFYKHVLAEYGSIPQAIKAGAFTIAKSTQATA